MLKILGATFVCQGCTGTLTTGVDLRYGYRCQCGWVLRARPFLGRWVTVVPA
jgi:hypothetical protein